jgi:thiopeptide-type bacteriocin biosynthesis protein
VVPIRARRPIQIRQPSAPTPVAATAEPVPARRLPPGSEWTHLKLYSATAQHSELITGPVRSFVAELRAAGVIDSWFYIRYFDPMPHLRLRFRATDPAAVEHVVSRSTRWAGGLVAEAVASDFCLVSYDRETERYGGAESIETLEEVFRANSDACVDLLRLLHDCEELEPELVGALALQHLYTGFGVDVSSLVTDLLGRGIAEESHRSFRKMRTLLCELMVPGEIRPDPRASQYAGRIEAVFARQETSLTEAGHRIRALAGGGRLTRSEQNLMESLTHMQCNRLLGADRPREQRSFDLWALAHRAINLRPDLARRRPDLARRP